jgi:hypothetical protein
MIPFPSRLLRRSRALIKNIAISGRFAMTRFVSVQDAEMFSLTTTREVNHEI